jgi:hypothetical protein
MSYVDADRGYEDDEDAGDRALVTSRASISIE